jgi:Spy/CpxP family protein refolding chaperone
MTIERSTRARLTTALVLLLVLASGVVLGMALDRQLAARGAIGEEARRTEGRPGMDGRNRGFDPRSRDSTRDSSQGRAPSQRGPSLIVEQVGLSEIQKVQVDSIVGYYSTQMTELHEEFNGAYNPRYREIMVKSREDMLSILTAEQRVVYDSLLVEMRARREESRRDSTGSSGDGRGEGRGGPRIP